MVRQKTRRLGTAAAASLWVEAVADPSLPLSSALAFFSGSSTNFAVRRALARQQRLSFAQDHEASRQIVVAQTTAAKLQNVSGISKWKYGGLGVEYEKAGNTKRAKTCGVFLLLFLKQRGAHLSKILLAVFTWSTSNVGVAKSPIHEAPCSRVESLISKFPGVFFTSSRHKESKPCTRK